MSRPFRLVVVTVALIGMGAGAAEAQQVDKWRISEVVTAIDGNARNQYIELVHPGGGCFFASSRVEVFYPDGQVLATQFPWAATVCPAGRTYTIATAGAAQRLGFAPERTLIMQLPQAAGQVCFRSSTIRYDCLRWGDIVPAGSIGDFSGMTDLSNAAAAPSDFSITRQRDTDVVSADFVTYGPTPGRVNPIGVDDAGVLTGPDAATIPDGNLPDVYIPDARVDATPDDGSRDDSEVRFDGGPIPTADGGSDASRREPPYVPVFDASGGCACRAGTGGPGRGLPASGWLMLVGLVSWAAVRRRRASRQAATGPAARAARSPKRS